MARSVVCLDQGELEGGRNWLYHKIKVSDQVDQSKFQYITTYKGSDVSTLYVYLSLPVLAGQFRRNWFCANIKVPYLINGFSLLLILLGPGMAPPAMAMAVITVSSPSQPSEPSLASKLGIYDSNITLDLSSSLHFLLSGVHSSSELIIGIAI